MATVGDRPWTEAQAHGGTARARYLPIADHGVIGNLRTVAVIGVDGAIAWCCLPHLDRPSVFAAILDHARGGRFRVAARGAARGAQRYLDGTNVLETVFDAARGRLVVTDLMPVIGRLDGTSRARPEVLRLIGADGGEVEAEVEWAPRFDYARGEVRIARARGGFVASGSRGERLALGGLRDADRAEVVDDGAGPTVRASLRLAGGERRALVTRWDADDARCDLGAAEDALAATVAAWRGWLARAEARQPRDWAGTARPALERSELALKLLCHDDTGAVAAAATTSLPEWIGGERNWDYRYAWIRDAALTVQALGALGHLGEAGAFLDWAERVSELRDERGLRMRIMYGLHGEEDLEERVLPHLEGYRGSRPVRIGNAAATQRQPDIYGELMSAAYELVRRDHVLAPRTATFLSAVADRACDVWCAPSDGIWEQRTAPRHYVHTKLMVWVALDRALLLHARGALRGDAARWARSRDELRRDVLARGFDPAIGAFVQAYGHDALDAANLLIPLQELLPFDDPRVQGTIDATLAHLTDRGLVYRYHGDDGVPGREGAFALCTFWMVDALAMSGRLDEAHAIYEGLVGRANHLGLWSEQLDPRTGELLGNLPQAFTHLGFVNSTLYLRHAEGIEVPGPPLVGTAAHHAGRR